MRGHGTRCAYTVTLVAPRNGRVIYRNCYCNAVTADRVKANKFKCSPLFVPSKCDRAFNVVSTRRGGGFSRHSGTLTRVEERLGSRL